MLKKTTRIKIWRARQLYLLLLLPLIWLVIFKYVPMAGLQIAFRDFSSRKGIWGSEWVGLEKFRKFFSDRQFTRLMVNTLRVSIYYLVAGFLVPIVLALGLNIMKNGIFKKTVQTLTYIPHFISVVVLVGMLIQLINPIMGLYGSVAKALTGERPVDILANPASFPHLYVWSGIWQNAGWNSIIYAAALASSDQQLHEAAQVDGCSDLKYLFQIVLPLSKSIFAVVTLYYAVAHWNAYFNAFMYLMNERLYPLQIFLREILIASKVSADMMMDEAGIFNSTAGLQYVLKYSLIVVATVPMLILYPFVQKHFVKGVMIGAVKG